MVYLPKCLHFGNLAIAQFLLFVHRQLPGFLTTSHLEKLNEIRSIHLLQGKRGKTKDTWHLGSLTQDTSNSWRLKLFFWGMVSWSLFQYWTVLLGVMIATAHPINLYPDPGGEGGGKTAYALMICLGLSFHLLVNLQPPPWNKVLLTIGFLS